jgi:hypothetical protein
MKRDPAGGGIGKWDPRQSSVPHWVTKLATPKHAREIMHNAAGFDPLSLQPFLCV